MKKLFLLLFFPILSIADVDVSGHLDFQTQAFLLAPPSKHKNDFTLKQTLELKYENENLSGFAKLYAQEDYYDVARENEQNKRSFIRLDELYLKYDFEDDSIQVGKSIKYWGALELKNIADVFNPIDFRADMFNPQKLGAWNLSYSHFSGDGEFSFIVKFYEQNQEFAGNSYVYNFFPSYIEYDKNLKTSHGASYPSIYLSYSASLESEYALDYAFIIEHGYDSQRYFSSNFLNPLLISQNTYLVNKFITYNTLVIDATLIKLEALYADVLEDVDVGDYSHIAFGFEHTVDNIYGDAGVGIISEYYRYDTYESDKYNDLNIYEIMQNDIFMGLRYSFNNEDDSFIVGGIVHDFDYDEQTYYLKYETRAFDSFKLILDYYYVTPSKNTQTAYASLGRHQRVGLDIAYYF